MISLRPVTLLILALGAANAWGSGKIYSYMDEEGVRHYTDVPDDNRYRLLQLSPHERSLSGERYDARVLARATQYDTLIETAAAANGVKADLLRAVIVVESGFNSRAVSKAGAIGLMQLMPATAARFGTRDPFDPRDNIRAGARYLRFLLDRFGNDTNLALAAYNAGEEAVQRNGGRIPPFAETMAYVPRVMKIFRTLAELPRVAKSV